jgi:alpha-glucosidase
MQRLICSFAFALLATMSLRADEPAKVLKSPDGQLAITFSIAPGDAAQNGSGQLTYSVTFHGKPLIDESKLALTFEGARPLGENVQMTGSTPSSADETYHLLTGRAITIRDHYNALRLDVAEPAAGKER